MARTFTINLAGTSFKNNDGSDRQHLIRSFAIRGMPLVLIHEPDNQFDPNAVRVCINTGLASHQIGYLESRLAGEVVRLAKRGGNTTASIFKVVGGSTECPTLGVVLEVTKHDPGDTIPANHPPELSVTPSRAQSRSFIFGRFLGRVVGRIFR